MTISIILNRLANDMVVIEHYGDRGYSWLKKLSQIMDSLA
jgi:hypothetical protein